MIEKGGTFWTRGRVIFMAVGVVLTVGGALIQQGRWTERITQAVESMGEDHGRIEDSLRRLAVVVETHVDEPAHEHQKALNAAMHAEHAAVSNGLAAFIAQDTRVEERWFNEEWPAHGTLHQDIEMRLRRLEAKR